MKQIDYEDQIAKKNVRIEQICSVKNHSMAYIIDRQVSTIQDSETLILNIQTTLKYNLQQQSLQLFLNILIHFPFFSPLTIGLSLYMHLKGAFACRSYVATYIATWHACMQIQTIQLCLLMFQLILRGLNADASFMFTIEVSMDLTRIQCGCIIHINGLSDTLNIQILHLQS